MEKVEIKNHIKQIRGIAYGGNDSINHPKDDYLPVLRSNNINEGSLNFEDLVYVPANLIKEVQLLKKGDLLITASTGSVKVIGKNGAVKNDYNGSFGAFCKVVRPLKSINPDYLKHFFQSKYYRKTIQSVINGANINNIKNEHLDNLEILLPSLTIQQKIANILDKADELSQYNKQLIEKYDTLTQSLFGDMFGDPVRNEKGWENKTIEELTKSEKGSIKRGPFGGALKKEIFVKDGYLVYEQFHALNNDFSMARYFINEEKFKELKGFEVKPRDIIISCSGVYLGKLAIVPKSAKKGIINQALLKVTIDENVMRNDFFIFHFSHKNFREKYFDANRGAGIPNFPPMSDFKKFPFISPPIELQNQFAERIQLIETQKQQAQEALVKSEQLFQGLLQQAFNGELN